jgi:hypothetical protein
MAISVTLSKGVEFPVRWNPTNKEEISRLSYIIWPLYYLQLAQRDFSIARTGRVGHDGNMSSVWSGSEEGYGPGLRSEPSREKVMSVVEKEHFNLVGHHLLGSLLDAMYDHFISSFCQ